MAKPNWTPSRQRSYIVSALRRAWLRHPNRTEALGRARVSRGVYECAGCGEHGPPKLPPKPGNTTKRNNAALDHIEPVIDPAVGFTSWDEFMRRLFCDPDGLQLLCYVCHSEKTARERGIGAERRRREKAEKSRKQG